MLSLRLGIGFISLFFFSSWHTLSWWISKFNVENILIQYIESLSNIKDPIFNRKPKLTLLYDVSNHTPHFTDHSFHIFMALGGTLLGIQCKPKRRWNILRGNITFHMDNLRSTLILVFSTYKFSLIIMDMIYLIFEMQYRVRIKI